MPVKVDLSGVMAGLDKLASPKFRESLARSMAVAGGKVYRDEAKRWVPVESGRLKAAIYLAYRDDESRGGKHKYRVSWNSSHLGGAPHGHLVEFGHWQTYAIYRLPNGDWVTDPGRPLAQPKWIAAKPFMRPAWDIARGAAQAAMIERGRERFAELLREQYTPADAEFV